MSDTLIFLCMAGIAVSGFVLGWLAYSYFSAPEGWQDEKTNTFKFGKEPTNKP
jgi:hypothetical protein